MEKEVTVEPSAKWAILMTVWLICWFVIFITGISAARNQLDRIADRLDEISHAVAKEKP